MELIIYRYCILNQRSRVLLLKISRFGLSRFVGFVSGVARKGMTNFLTYQFSNPQKLN